MTAVRSAVEQDQLARLMQVIPVVAVMATIGAVVASYPFLAKGPSWTVIAWLGAFALVSLLRIAGSLYYRGSGAARASSQTWYRWAATGTMAHALLWGVCSLALSDPGDPLAESVLHIVLASVAMGAAVHLSGFYPLLVAYIACVIGPLILRDAWIGSTYHLLLAFMSTMIGVYALLNSRNQSQALAEIMAQRRKNADLIEALRRENAAANAARLAAEQANAAKARLFAAANHDLRQPLQAVALLAQTMHAGSTNAEVQVTSRQIGECVDSLGNLVDAMLELSQLDSGSITPQSAPFALEALLQEITTTYQPIARAKGLQLHADATDLVILSDRRMVMRVLSNLVANAVRYTGQGHVSLRLSQEGTQVRLTVHDSGLGIAADDLPRIFEEFYQVGNKARDRRQGLGLGLATAKRMSDLLGLGLAVQSQPGQGSAFSVVLPLGDAADLATQPESNLGAGHDVAHGRRVLVIEDDEVSRQAMRQLLENWGCQVHAAANAPQALAWVEQGYRPECVLADLRLGDGLDGGQIVQRVRALLGARLPALLITGDTATASVRSAEHSGLAMLRKPIKPAQLRAFINEAFAQRG